MGATPQPDRARTALRAFLANEEGATTSWRRADRALTLHMLRHLAPEFFATERLRGALEEAMASLAAIPRTFEAGLDPAESMARVDAAYLEHLHFGAPSAPLDADALRGHLLVGSFLYGGTWAWLLGELAERAGFEARAVSPPRFGAVEDRTEELYFLTHRFMLETSYFAKPLSPGALSDERDRLLQATPWILNHRAVDLAAETALCLKAAGRTDAREYAELIRLVARHQTDEGTVVDPTIPPDDPDRERRTAHATASGLLAFASTLP